MPNRDYFDHVRPCYIEAWPDTLCRLSIAQLAVPLSLAEARALGTNMLEFGEAFVPRTPQQAAQEKAAFANARARMRALLDDREPPAEVPGPVIDWRPQDVTAVRRRTADAVAAFPDGAFIRLGSRSPKDAWGWHAEESGPRVSVGEDPLRFLLDASERVYEDLTLALAHDYAPTIWVRHWLDIPGWAEFRCFMKDRRLVGVSQYQTSRHHPEVARYADTVAWSVASFFDDFRRACHLADVVFDVFVEVRERLNERVTEVKLLEINPWGPMSDPCLFNWSKDFDGTLRHLDAGRQVVSVPLGR